MTPDEVRGIAKAAACAAGYPFEPMEPQPCLARSATKLEEAFWDRGWCNSLNAGDG